jgi:hypothetical protein
MERITNLKQDMRRLMAMTPLRIIAMALLPVIAFGATATTWATSQPEMDALRAATERFKSLDAAIQAGYGPFMDCFDNPGVGAMGYHYVNGNLLDLKVEALAPEAMVYEADANGELNLVAVEYIVPAKEWNEQNTEMPMLYGRHFHLNEKLGVLVLHAWIWKDNPSGMFEDWNPTVSCRPLRVGTAGAVGMPTTGSGAGAELPVGMAALSITMVLLSLGVLARRRSLRPE